MADDDDFFGDSNQAGQALLKLVARANANIAELMRLSDYIPSVFFLDARRSPPSPALRAASLGRRSAPACGPLSASHPPHPKVA